MSEKKKILSNIPQYPKILVNLPTFIGHLSNKYQHKAWKRPTMTFQATCANHDTIRPLRICSSSGVGSSMDGSREGGTVSESSWLASATTADVLAHVRHVIPQALRSPPQVMKLCHFFDAGFTFLS